jgi:hypothetical protein
MLSTTIKKATLVGALATLLFALTAGSAFAAPVLKPGTTSYPGMSGTCTNCHTYASAAKPAAKKVVKKKSTSVSHPYIAKGKRKQGVAFKTWGYVAPKLRASTPTTLTIVVQSYMGHGSWVTTSGVAATATVAPKGKFKNKTNYTASLTIDRAARYRLRAKLVYVDTKGVERTKWSSWLYMRVYK